MKVSYVDGKGYTEAAVSPPRRSPRSPCRAPVNTPPFLAAGTQFNGIANTTAIVGPDVRLLLAVRRRSSTTTRPAAPDLLTYTATLADGSPLSTANLQFNFDPVSGRRRAQGLAAGGTASLAASSRRRAGATLDTPGQIAVRVTATDPGGLSVTNTFVINVLPPNSPPIASQRHLHHVRERRADHAALDRRAAQRYRPQPRPVHRGAGDRTRPTGR